jgi:Tfp pilus assembly protein PilN
MNTPVNYLLPRAPRSHVLWMLVLAFLAATAGLVHLGLQQTQLIELLTNQNNAMETAQRKVVAPKPSADDAERQRHWTAMRAERGFPWASVFDAVERADRSNIELLEFRPEKANRNIILRGEARDREALTAYLEALADQPGLRRLHLQHLQTTKREKFSTVAFEIKASIR